MQYVMLLGNGFEEIEALGTTDLLRRGGVEVQLCTINCNTLVLGAHQIAVEADLCLSELDSTQYDGVILPGGMGGTEALAATQGVLELIRDYDKAGKLVAAICAAPAIVLKASDILKDRKVTGYPAPALIEALGDNYTNATVVTDGNLITAAGPGSFSAFASAILTRLQGETVAKTVMKDALITLD